MGVAKLKMQIAVKRLNADMKLLFPEPLRPAALPTPHNREHTGPRSTAAQRIRGQQAQYKMPETPPSRGYGTLVSSVIPNQRGDPMVIS